MLQPWDTMSLRTADLGSVCVRARAPGLTQTPQQSHPVHLYTSLCTGKVNAIRKHKCLLCSPFYGRAFRWAILGELRPKGPKGGFCGSWRSVGLCWEKSKPEGPEGGYHQPSRLDRFNQFQMSDLPQRRSDATKKRLVGKLRKVLNRQIGLQEYLTDKKTHPLRPCSRPMPTVLSGS